MKPKWFHTEQIVVKSVKIFANRRETRKKKRRKKMK